MGRKTKYSEDVALFICQELENGKTLAHIIKEQAKAGVPDNYATIYNWMDQFPAFLEAYTRARERQAHTYADEIVYLGDNAIKDDKIAADKLKVQIDARKWHASKMSPTIFGEPVLKRNRVAREEEEAHIRRMKDVTPKEDPNSKVPKDPKQVARIMNYILMKNRMIEHKEKDE
jgi:hypothetical protein